MITHSAHPSNDEPIGRPRAIAIVHPLRVNTPSPPITGLGVDGIATDRLSEEVPPAARAIDVCRLSDEPAAGARLERVEHTSIALAAGSST
jgi:hypothetical protein